MKGRPKFESRPKYAQLLQWISWYENNFLSKYILNLKAWTSGHHHVHVLLGYRLDCESVCARLRITRYCKRVAWLQTRYWPTPGPNFCDPKRNSTALGILHHRLPPTFRLGKVCRIKNVESCQGNVKSAAVSKAVLRDSFAHFRCSNRSLVP